MAMVRFRAAERDALAAIVAWLDSDEAGQNPYGILRDHRSLLRSLLAKMDKKLVVVPPPTGLGSARFLEVMRTYTKGRVIDPVPDRTPNSYFARLARDVRDNGVTEEVAQKAALWISLWRAEPGKPIRLEPRLVALKAVTYAAKYDALNAEKEERVRAVELKPLDFEEPREPSGKDDA